MQICMNDVTIMQQGDMFSRIAACAAAGYGAMEFRKAALLKTLREGHTIGEIIDCCRENHIKPACVNAVESISFNGKRGFRVLSEAAEFLFYLCREMGCGTVEVIGSFKVPTEDADEIRRETAEAMRKLCDVAAPYGIRLALEFMALPGSSVTTLAQSIDILNEVDRANAGILFDTWHHYAGGGTPEEILRTPEGKMFMVHVSDCPAGTPMTIARSESYEPGDGVIPLREHIEALRSIGYDGAVSLEIMSPDVQAKPLEKILTDGREKLMPLL